MGLSSINCQGVLSLSFKLICPQLRQCFSTWHFLPSKHFPPVEKDHHVFGKIQCWCWLKCLKHPSGVDEDTEWNQWIPRSVEMKVEETSTSFPIGQNVSRDFSCCASPRVLFRLVLWCFLARNLLQLYFTYYSKYFDNNACFDFNDFNWRIKWDVKSIKRGFLLFALHPSCIAKLYFLVLLLLELFVKLLLSLHLVLNKLRISVLVSGSLHLLMLISLSANHHH